MADWSHPQLGDSYVDVLVTHLAGKDVDSITLMKSLPSNLPDGAMAYDRATDLFKEWATAGSVFTNKKLSIAGGGTGADNPTQAKVNLGLGSMANQDSSAVNITGGSISGITLDASVITSGIVALSRGGLGASLAIGASGTVLQSNGAGVVFGTDGSALTGLNASNLASGTVPLARLPSGIGSIVGEVNGIDNVGSSSPSTSFVASLLHVTITPSNSGHRVLVLGSVYVSVTPNNPSIIEAAVIALYRSIGGGAYTQVAILTGGVGYLVCSAGGSATGIGWASVPICFVDSPATTSSVDYKIYYKTNGGTANANVGAVNSTIVGLELV